MAEYLLDSSALIDWMNGAPGAAEALNSLIDGGHVLAVSSVSVGELYAGLAEDEWPLVDPFIDPLPYWDIDPATAKRAGLYRYSYTRSGLSLPITDTLIAALAVARDATLLTGNVKDFPMPNLRLQKFPP